MGVVLSEAEPDLVKTDFVKELEDKQYKTVYLPFVESTIFLSEYRHDYPPVIPPPPTGHQLGSFLLIAKKVSRGKWGNANTILRDFLDLLPKILFYI